MKDKQILLNQLLHELIVEKISDLHFNISDNSYDMIYRRHKNNIYSKKNHDVFILYEYIKYISGLDLNTTNTPQTGSFEYTIENTIYYFRFAVIETNLRKSGVLRVLNLSPILSLSEIVPDNHQIFNLLNITNGIILFCGKTGSGKSTSQFHFLKEFKNKQIYLLENPIEIYDPDFIQIDISKSNLSFETAMTQLFRHDPDIISLGEVRKKTELDTLVRAGLSGHLVTSTIHAGSIEHVISRLFDLGASRYELNHVLKAIIFQELKLNDKGEAYAQITVKDETEIKKEISKK